MAEVTSQNYEFRDPQAEKHFLESIYKDPNNTVAMAIYLDWLADQGWNGRSILQNTIKERFPGIASEALDIADLLTFYWRDDQTGEKLGEFLDGILFAHQNFDPQDFKKMLYAIRVSVPGFKNVEDFHSALSVNNIRSGAWIDMNFQDAYFSERQEEYYCDLVFLSASELGFLNSTLEEILKAAEVRGLRGLTVEEATWLRLDKNQPRQQERLIVAADLMGISQLLCMGNDDIGLWFDSAYSDFTYLDYFVFARRK